MPGFEEYDALRPTSTPVRTTDELKGVIPIEQVPKDYDPQKIVLFTNGTKKEFICFFDGAEYKVPAGKTFQVIEPLAYHFAYHLAQQLLTQPGIAEEVKTRLKEANSSDPKHVPGAKGVAQETILEYAKKFISDPQTPVFEPEEVAV